MISAGFHAFFWLEQHLTRLPCVGMIFDTIFGPAEDFEFVSRTTPNDAR